jgi:hypothetical protein
VIGGAVFKPDGAYRRIGTKADPSARDPATIANQRSTHPRSAHGQLQPAYQRTLDRAGHQRVKHQFSIASQLPDMKPGKSLIATQREPELDG